MDERKWIEQTLAGDTRSFSCLVVKYEKMAFTIAFRILNNREEAEEVVQDAFVKMYRALSGFQFDSKFSTWFYRIVYRTALSARKEQRPFLRIEEGKGYEQVTTDEADTASGVLERKDRQLIIKQLLGRLSADDSLMLTLFYLEECSIDEIHTITGLTQTNIKTKLFRARKRFYEELQKTMQQETNDIR
ncbi:RNA polymerase sigma factor [Parabacteroides sp. OttesenSCG-928-N08]|nr:RNA polymerase sigma factor [Parabacteroides sp. OttesenSCG-928-N08]